MSIIENAHLYSHTHTIRYTHTHTHTHQETLQSTPNDIMLNFIAYPSTCNLTLFVDSWEYILHSRFGFHFFPDSVKDNYDKLKHINYYGI